MDSVNKNEKIKNINDNELENDDSEIDEEELLDEINDNQENLDDLEKENLNENYNIEDNNDLFNDDEEIKNDFGDANLENLNNQINENVLEFNLNLNNLRKGIILNHKNEFFDIFFDTTFYSNRNLQVEKLVQYIKKDSNHGLTGLKNLKNTSFINTILQCLSHTLDLSYYLLSKSYTNEINKTSKSSI